MVLPSGVSADVFAKALQDFAGVVGKEWVLSSEEDINSYRDAYTPFYGEPDLELIPGAAVAPESAEEVQAIVRIANRHKVPIYAFSTGRDLGYGGSSPNLRGAIAVDLRRMRRVLEVNQTEGFLLIEPGINWIELYRYFEENNIPWRLEGAPQPAWGSPAGNSMDHGPGSFQRVYGVEVVLPNGDLMRTGMGALPTSKMWQNYYGYGPDVSRMFAQSNFGIVTKVGFWLTPKPSADVVTHSFTISSYRTEDMQPMIDVLDQLHLQGVLTGWNVSSPLRESSATDDGRTPWGPPEVKELLRRRDGGAWSDWETLGRAHNIPVIAGMGLVRGVERAVQATIDYCRDHIAAALPGRTFEVSTTTPFASFANRKPEVDMGILSIQRSNHGHAYLSPVHKGTAADVFAINDTIRGVMYDAGDTAMLDSYGFSGSAGGGVGGAGGGIDRKCGMLLIEFLITDDVQLNARHRDLMVKLVEALGKGGWINYRAPTFLADTIMQQYSFNNHALPRFLESIKDAIDPNGILAPGARGIWPAARRAAHKS